MAGSLPRSDVRRGRISPLGIGRAGAAPRRDEVARGPLADRAVKLAARLDALGEAAGRLAGMDAERASLHIRGWIDRVMTTIQGCDLLLEAADDLKSGRDHGKKDVLDYHLLSQVERADSFDNRAYEELEAKLGR